MFTECYRTKLCNKLGKRRQTPDDEDEVLLNDHPPADGDQRDPPQPTVSWIDAPQRREQPYSAMVNVGET